MSAPLRFLHAAGLRLDHPLSGTGTLSDVQRRIAEDATLTAFDRLIDVAIERQVDFVLLVGDTFDESDASLRAAAALADGCARLAEQHIRVFVLPGRDDPAIAWHSLPELPPNVTLLLARDDDPIAFVRDGQLVATIARAEPSRSAGAGMEPGTVRDGSTRRGPFAIGLLSLDSTAGHAGNTGRCRDKHPRTGESPPEGEAAGPHTEPDATLQDFPFDYLALGGNSSRQTIRTPAGVAHHPGSLQGMDRRHTGHHGFTLVETADSGAVRQQFVPAAPVRWEEFILPADATLSRERLLELMRHELSACRCDPGEQLWLVRWTTAAAGPLAPSLTDESFLDELRADLARATGLAVPVRHSFRLIPARAAVQAGRSDSPLDFARFHAELGLPARDQLAALGRLDGCDPAAAARLRSLVPHLDAPFIDDEAARLGSLVLSQA